MAVDRQRWKEIARMPLALVPRSTRNALRHRLRARRELRDARDCDLVVLSRAKSGRTWLRAMLSRLYQQHHGLPENQLLELDNFHRQNASVPRILFTHGRYLQERFVDPAWRAGFGGKKILFLVRHPCDIAVSEYFQSTKRAKDHKADLYGIDREASMFDFVMRGSMGLPAIIDYFNGWEPIVAQLRSALVVRYEDMRARPVETLSRAIDFLDAPFSKAEVEEAVIFASFDNLKELERSDFFRNQRLQARDPDDPDSYKVRRGVVGGYRDYFDAEQVAQMEKLVAERLTHRLGYAGAPAESPA